MRRHIARAAWFLPPLLLAICLYHGLCNYTSEVMPRGFYLFAIAMEALIALQLFVLAFLAHRSGNLARSRWLLAGAALVGLWALSDTYVAVLCHRSSGPGGRLCLTHVNWYERYVRNNDLGYWEDDLEPFRRGAGRRQVVIAALGDSFTWGQGLPGRQHRFSDQLERLLNEGAPGGFRVLNFGWGGTGTVVQRDTLMPHVAQVDPDVVLICYLVNDIEDYARAVKVSYPEFGALKKGLLIASPTLNYLYWNLVNPLEGGSSGAQVFFAHFFNYYDQESFARHAEDLGGLIGQVRAAGARPVFVLLPWPHMWTGFDPAYRDLIYGKLAEVARDAGAPVVALQDLEEEFPPRQFQLSSLDTHPNARVHQAIAERLHAWMMAHPEEWRP